MTVAMLSEGSRSTRFPVSYAFSYYCCNLIIVNTTRCCWIL